MKKKKLPFNKVRLAATGLFGLACTFGMAQTTTFGYTGGVQTYTVPAGVTSIIVDVFGAQGGNGGAGGEVSGILTVVPGSVLDIYVGGAGTYASGAAGGFNGGGNAGTGSNGGPGSGGGASDIRVSPYGLANRMVVAGGGGGVGGWAGAAGGAGGCTTGNDGGTGQGQGGFGGTQSAGGSGGVGNNCGNGFAGSIGQGGTGGSCNYGGGGGGGGYYGGGGGGADNDACCADGGGGGGGSSYSPAGTTCNSGVHFGDGLVTITIPPGAALNLDGVDDLVNIGTTMNSTLDASSSLTVEAWVYPTDADAFGVIVGNYSTSAAGMQFLLRRDGNSFTFWTDRGTGFTNVITGNIVAYNTWQHVAGVWNSTTQSMMIYVNGVLQGTTTGVVGSTLGGSTNPIMIGWNTINEQMTGNVDEVRIWNRALCQSEIVSHMSCEIPTSGTNLLANYHFNQGNAAQNNAGVTILTDASGNGYDGTLMNFTLNGATSNWIAPGGVTSGVSCAAFVPGSVTVTASSQTNISCNGGSNGAATVSATGGSNLVYDWTPGNPTGDGTASISGLSAGTYTCTVTNDCGGTGSTVFTITEPSVISVSSSQTNVSCNGGSDGSVTLTVSGGTSPYTFDWNSGAYTTQNLTGIPAGTYAGTLTDANGCTNSGTIVITEPTLLVASSSATSILCNGGTANITVTETGGTAPYTGDGTFTVSAGPYSYTVTDMNGCTSTTTGTVTEPTMLMASSSATTILCNGGTADITVTETGGTGPYTGDGTFNVNAGPYSYTVTDANGCTSTTTITVTEPTAISTSVTQVNVSCNGGSDGSIDLTVTGGTAPYTFDWNSGAFTTEDLTGLMAGSYVGQLTDANGCTDGGTVVITEPPVLGAVITTSTDPSSCGGMDGAIDITVSGGTGVYTFLWDNSATTEDLIGIGAGAYNCTVTDANGCTTTIGGSISDPNAPTVTLSLATDTLCAADGAYTLTGGSPAGGTFSGTAVSAGTFNPSLANAGMNYISYTYTDPNGCTGSTTDSIYVDACTGINLHALSAGNFTVMPNPNNGSFMLQLNTTQAAHVMIYDALGQLVNEEIVQPDVMHPVNIDHSGVYFITVLTVDGHRTSQRVVVTK